jgi:predicted dehydrogenase
VIGIGVIGYGYWGPNLARNFMELSGTSLRAVCDSSPKAREKAAARCPGAKVLADARDVVADPSVDAVVISTPVRTHFELAKMALEAGKHVLLTKPMTSSVDEALRLCELADKGPGLLMVDHTFIYTGAVRKVKQLFDEGSLGELLYYDSVRVNLGLFQSDVNVVWDLAPHDLSILEYLLEDQPVAVSAHGMKHVAGQPENMASVTLFYAANRIAHINVNWLAPVKIRQTLIGATRKMVVYDDMEPSEKIKIYDRGIELAEVESSPEKINELRVGYRSGDMLAPKLDGTEALRFEAKHFLDCVEKRAKPLCDGHAGLRVVRVLEATNQSMAEGRVVELSRVGK